MNLAALLLSSVVYSQCGTAYMPPPVYYDNCQFYGMPSTSSQQRSYSLPTNEAEPQRETLQEDAPREYPQVPAPFLDEAKYEKTFNTKYYNKDRGVVEIIRSHIRYNGPMDGDLEVKYVKTKMTDIGRIVHVPVINGYLPSCQNYKTKQSGRITDRVFTYTGEFKYDPDIDGSVVNYGTRDKVYVTDGKRENDPPRFAVVPK